MGENDWFKICKSCGDKIYYKTRNAYYANRHKNTPCRKCNGISQTTRLKGIKRPPFSDEWKRNIAIGHKKSEVWKASMNTPYKEKHRRKMVRLIKENKSRVGYNPLACIVFDVVNRKLGWNGQHAKNGLEKSVDVFFLDYYDPIHNIAIEWDEKHHRKPSRQKEIG